MTKSEDIAKYICARRRVDNHIEECDLHSDEQTNHLSRGARTPGVEPTPRDSKTNFLIQKVSFDWMSEIGIVGNSCPDVIIKAIKVKNQPFRVEPCFVIYSFMA